MENISEREFVQRQFEMLKSIGTLIEQNEKELKQCSDKIEYWTEKYNYCVTRRKVLEVMSESASNLSYK